MDQFQCFNLEFRDGSPVELWSAGSIVINMQIFRNVVSENI